MAQLHSTRIHELFPYFSQSSLSESSDTPTNNPPAFSKSYQNSGPDLQDSKNPDFDFLNQAFEEFTTELEDSIRKRCANSPLHTILLKYINSKNLERKS